MEPAVFGIYSPRPGWVAATTRSGGVEFGLPGGKINPGEYLLDGLEREAREEGWKVVTFDPRPVYAARIEGRPVLWFEVDSAAARFPRAEDEVRGIRPCCVRVEALRTMGNPEALRRYWERIRRKEEK